MMTDNIYDALYMAHFLAGLDGDINTSVEFAAFEASLDAMSENEFVTYLEVLPR